MIQGVHLGTKRVFPINPDSVEHNTAYRGAEFGGNAIVFTGDVGVSINGTEAVKAENRDVIYIYDNYYYNFLEETLIAQAIMQVPNLGVSQSETNTNGVALVKDAESASLVTMTLEAGFGDVPAGKGTIEVSFTVENTGNKDADLIVRVYDDGVLEGTDDTQKIIKNSTTNYFNSSNIGVTIDSSSVITVTAELGEAGNVIAPVSLVLRKET